MEAIVLQSGHHSQYCKCNECNGNCTPAKYTVVMQSHDGDVLKNFITESTEADVLKRTEQLQAQYPGFTALWI